MNLGSRIGYSVLEVIRAAEKVLDVEAKILFSGRREGDPVVIQADASKALQVLEWETLYGIDDMIRSISKLLKEV